MQIWAFWPNCGHANNLDGVLQVANAVWGLGMSAMVTMQAITGCEGPMIESANMGE